MFCIFHRVFFVFSYFLFTFALMLRRIRLVRGKRAGHWLLGKTFTWRFCLWLYRTSQLLDPVKTKATVDVYGVCYISLVCLFQQKVYWVVIHIGVGYLGVARSDWLGNAKALKSGTSNRYRFPRFFFLYGLILIYFEPSGSGICGHYMKL